MSYVDFLEKPRKIRKKGKKSFRVKPLIINELRKMAKKRQKNTKKGMYKVWKACYNVFIQNQVRQL